jgi:hypothetical protein
MLKKIMHVVFVLPLFYTTLFGQIPVSYKSVQVKWEYPPISPLPPEKTFNIQLPDSMSYLKGRGEIRPYWSPFGLQIINKWDEKKPADYTFQMRLYGMIIKSTEIQERKSSTSITGMEYLRNYVFSFPTELVIIDNSTKQAIKTITIASNEDEFKQSFHRNFFITDSFNPNYKNEVGFDSIGQLLRIQETDIKVLKRMEGLFASDVLFEKIKSCLAQLYDKSKLRVLLTVMNPKEKNRKYDFKDFDVASQKMFKAFELLKENKNDESAKALLNEAESFYEQKSNTSIANFEDYLPAMVHANLTEINLVKNNLLAAESYLGKVNADRKPGLNFSFTWESPYEEHFKFLQLRNALESNRAFYHPQKVERIPQKKVKSNENLTKGYVVTIKGDTLFGKLRDFSSTTWNDHSATLIDQTGKELKFSVNDMSSVSGDSLIYETVDYRFNGVFSGQRAPGKKLLLLLYASPTIRFYFFKQIDEFVYYFPKTNTYKRYKPFSRTDGASYLTNQNKKLGEVFSDCPDLVGKIEAGAYELKKESSIGHIQAVTDFEMSCGSKEAEKNYKKLFKEEVGKKYH